MSYTIIDSDTTLKSYIYDENHVTIYCYFKSATTPVDVTDLSFDILSGQTSVLSKILILKPLQKDNKEEVGKYIVTFLSKGLSAGTYTAKATGTYNSTPIELTQTLQFQVISRTQYLIDTLRCLLNGKYNLDIPNKYLTFDPRKKRWEDGQLYTCIKAAVRRCNEYNPPTDWSTDDIPCVQNVMLYSQMTALGLIAELEDLNYFNITTPYKVDIYKGDKIKDLMRFYNDQFERPFLDWKMTYYLNNMIGEGAVAITMQRVPIRILAPVSDELFFHTLGW